MNLPHLLCRTGWHAPVAPGRWNGGYCFTTCRRCGRDMVRSAFGEWHVPKGHRVIWSAQPPGRSNGATPPEPPRSAANGTVPPQPPPSAANGAIPPEPPPSAANGASHPPPPTVPLPAASPRAGPVRSSPFDFDDFA